MKMSGKKRCCVWLLRAVVTAAALAGLWWLDPTANKKPPVAEATARRPSFPRQPPTVEAPEIEDTERRDGSADPTNRAGC
jgi:hypothetical protein